ncbi:MAG: SAV_915 family protein [Haloechinothrix sp.]
MTDATDSRQQNTPIPPEFPPVVYLPCAEHTTEATEAVVELRQTRDGRMALMAYSALDRLKYCCGEQQPWLVMPTAHLDKLQEARPFQMVLLDVIIPEEFRHGVSA